MLLLEGAVVTGSAAGQAPADDLTAVPATTAVDTTQQQQATHVVDAVVTGWSFRDEVDSAATLHGREANLDAGHPEIVLFLDAPASKGAVEFRYRLNSYDADWTTTRQRVVHYRRLPPGTYRFELQARLPGAAWGAPRTALVIHQEPFFYQTWYAYVSVGAVLVVLTIQVLKQRDQLMKGQIGMVLQERNRIASECHDTLMAGFAAISWQLEATAKLLREQFATDQAAANSYELARSMVAHCQAEARRIIWDLRDSDEITNSLTAALQDATSNFQQRSAPRTTLAVEGVEISISPSAVHHLVCIGQEAVTNAIRHANASTVEIRVLYKDEQLSLSVTDDGRGFQPGDRSVRAGHFGISVMEERARKIGGSLDVNSAVGSGTQVVVTVAFHHVYQPSLRQHHVVRWIGV